MVDYPIQLGDVAPNFEADTTDGRIVFHDWIENSWCVLFSHPRDFTPVCTTELGCAAQFKSQFDERNVKLIALSISDLANHQAWVSDINNIQKTSINFPLIADEKGKIARLYGMIHPHANENLTARTVFIIDPSKRVRLIMIYPSSTGRNFLEILRVVDALQLTDAYKVATPANWQNGEDCIVLADLTDQELKQLMPQSYKALKNYLRIVPYPGSKKTLTNEDPLSKSID